MYKRLIAVRHGQTYSNERDIVSGGNDDPKLTSKGESQAYGARPKLLGSVEAVFSSPKQRCIETGRIAFGIAPPRNQQLDELNERYYGRFDSGPNDDWKAYMESLKPQLDHLTEAERRTFTFEPGIENEAHLIERALGAFATVASMARSADVVGIATSGGILRGVLLGTGHDLPTGAIDNLAQVEADYDGKQLHITSTSGVHFNK